MTPVHFDITAVHVTPTNEEPIMMKNIDCTIAGIAMILSLLTWDATAVEAVSASKQMTPRSRQSLRELDYVEPAATARLPGVTLKSGVLKNLHRQFDKADTGHSGRVSREQLQMSGWIFMASHFDEIDEHKSGTVSFDELIQFMKRRGADL